MFAFTTTYVKRGVEAMVKNVVEMRGITMRFPAVVANAEVDFDLRKGEIHALVGENGAGKTTLMNILYGLLQPTEGEIYINGERKILPSSLDAIQAGIGMVHQHFMLIPRLTVAENIVLGREPRMKGARINRKEAARIVADLAAEYNFRINPTDRVRDISLSTMQKVEIAKALYREADILILDEPTAVLTPQEIDDLGIILKNLKKLGKSIIIITHKLREVMAFSDRITVLRAGRVVGTVNTEETDTQEITRMMVGRDISLDRDKKSMERASVVLEFKDVSYGNKLKNASFCVHAGEIVGIAGIDDNGQQELTELAAGVLQPSSGSIFLDGVDITHKNSRESKLLGIGFIPQDRQRTGLILKMPIWENLILGYQRNPQYTRRFFLNKKKAKIDGGSKIKDYDIRPADGDILVKNLSGGNQQKVVVARESSRASRIIVADQPSRGVDVGAIELIYQVFDKACQDKKAILVSSLELDELMTISNRIIVLAEGRITGIVDGSKATRYEIGDLMLKQSEVVSE